MCSSTSTTTLPPPYATTNPVHILTDTLIAAEPLHSPLQDYFLRCQRRSTHRQDSINWILNVHAHYKFQPLTAILSVNYFDRFLSTTVNTLEWKNGWEYQLLSVACLSLAAKMEEPQVPSLLDLQISEPRFLFEPKSVQKMELWVMSNLNWRLRAVTPFDFLHYFISNIKPSAIDELHFYFKCSDIIIKTIRVIDFLGFRPSVIAAAAVLSAAGEVVEIPETYYEKVNKEMVLRCHQLMEEYLVDTCPMGRKQWRSDDEPPPSPDGVLDAAATCSSCDTRSGDRFLTPIMIPVDESKRVSEG